MRTVYELMCDQCSKQFERSYVNKSILTSNHFCSRKCKHDSQKYGILSKIENPFSTTIVKEKIRSTNLKRYGFENASKSEIVKEKIRNTNLAKYGTTCALSNIEITDKIKKTNFERYGVESSGWLFSVTKHKRGHIVIDNRKVWFRSSWEQQFLEWCIKNSISIISNINIQYWWNNKQTTYYADFMIFIDGKNVLCEIKPLKLSFLPKNQAKFNAAKIWCSEHNASFLHINEKILANLDCVRELIK